MPNRRTSLSGGQGGAELVHEGNRHDALLLADRAAGVGVKMNVPSTLPPPRTGSSTCLVGRPGGCRGPAKGVQPHRPSLAIHAPFRTAGRGRSGSPAS